MVLVPDEAELKLRFEARRKNHERMLEGKSVRFKRRMERIWRTETNEEPVKVRVLPKNDRMREILVHPDGDLAFHQTGSVEWPLDQFTLRRIRDGDVTIDESHGHSPVHDVKPEAVAGHGGTVPVRRPTVRSGRPAPPAPQQAE